MLVALLLVFLIPIIHYSLSQAAFQVRFNQIENIGRRVGKAADAVFAMGPGSREVVTITVPGGVHQINIQKNSLVVNASFFGKHSSTVFATHVNMTGNLSVYPGTFDLLILANETDVIITNKNYTG